MPGPLALNPGLVLLRTRKSGIHLHHDCTERLLGLLRPYFLELRQNLVDECAAVVRVRNIGAVLHVVFPSRNMEAIHAHFVYVAATNDPGTPVLVIYHRNSVIGVVGVRFSTLDAKLLVCFRRHSKTSGLRRAERREEPKVQ